MPKAKKKEAPKKAVKNEAEVTDILEDYFVEDGVPKKKLTYMNGNKKVKEEIVND